ncbi:STAS/SEC14 domain-containing protein [Pseudonocardia bannensis]|uniref:STAS/SEC14 domain-containing protein n=1 Tax=Pseudonocardia bannensis TaxID=630973 RepID=A0A848DF18_9PSEU|nr:STAS/SEC14 domain-containing protein [Pseudonocardia bannensis]NMH91220.1 STAS/SEC14 domain-containing protein [Pseudonocardia bannensis]
MIEQVRDLPPGVDGVRSSGKLTREDYDAVVVPLVEEALRDRRRLRCLVEVPDFDGITPGAAWEDVTLGLRALGAFDGCAIVSDLGWIRESARLAAFLMPCTVRVFAQADHDEAVAWLTALPGAPRITHRLIGEAGVVVVEVGAPLSVVDIDALATVVDEWLATHASLHGLVLNARVVPGWDSLSALVRHLRFVLGHSRRVDKVAFAVDGTLATLATTLAGHVVHPEVRRFSFDELDAAVDWATA